jgi:uncharacterized protein (DUF1778 family)
MYNMSKETKDAFIIVRVTQSGKNVLTDTAELKGIGLSEFVREILEPYMEDD